ncbi:MAG TPA: phage terminase small subunit P27 family [Candidatus Dormibacteraeota bacterium]|jgi:P27 family predicted phage terminase small subunit|nr:phage terminase small subunit P27 family [Candidatus Dormibacteraeota bacterium]
MPAQRKSELLHELHGSKPHDRTADLSHVPAGRPKFPKDLDPALRPVFKRLCRLLQERQVLTAGDVELIRLYCFAYDRHERQAVLLRKEGEVCTYTRLDSNGQPHDVVKENVRMKLVAQAERQMASILSQLGLTQVAKDRAKPVKQNKATLEVIPGSIADTMPWLLEGRPAPHQPSPLQVAPEDMVIEEDAPRVVEDESEK